MVQPGTRLCGVQLDNAPHGVYNIFPGFTPSGGTIVDFPNAEIRKNGQRLFPLGSTVGPQSNFVLILDPRDTISIHSGPVAGTGAANYLASLAVNLVHELSTDPTEEPDVMAILSVQQQRIGETLARLADTMERLTAKL